MFSIARRSAIAMRKYATDAAAAAAAPAASAAAAAPNASAVALRRQMEQDKKLKQKHHDRMVKMQQKLEHQVQRINEKRAQREENLKKKLEKHTKDEKLRLFKERLDLQDRVKLERQKAREQREADLQRVKQQKQAKKLQAKERKARKQQGRPKRAMTNFIWYFTQHFKAIQKEMLEKAGAEKVLLPQVVREAKQRFDALSADARAVYDRLAAEDKLRYRAENERYKKARDANKKPPTSYVLFIIEKGPEYRTANPNASQPELVKLMAAEWRGMTAEQKQPYVDRAADAKKQYEASHSQ